MGYWPNQGGGLTHACFLEAVPDYSQESDNAKMARLNDEMESFRDEMQKNEERQTRLKHEIATLEEEYEVEKKLVEDTARIQAEEEANSGGPQICYGRPFTTEDGCSVVASVDSGLDDEWASLSVDQVLKQ